MIQLTPREIVRELDRYIIGQDEAKRAVAVALRNRYRRAQLPPEIREEVTPKNILMVGPTGVGKTEIARRLAKLVDAPFVKVEATKFTEVGYVGRDVESIVRDLLEASIRLVKEQHTARVHQRAEKNAEERLVDLIVKPIKKKTNPLDILLGNKPKEPELPPEEKEKLTTRRSDVLEKLRSGEMEHVMVEVEVEETAPARRDPRHRHEHERHARLHPSQAHEDPQGGSARGAAHTRRRGGAEPHRHGQRLFRGHRARRTARHRLSRRDRQGGWARRGQRRPDVSREGVQRDILPIVEGSTVNTKYGPVRTDHMLFIAAGAFHVSKVTDLIPELQGRFPVRVDLKPLTREDYKRILTQPENALIRQYQMLLKVDNVSLTFDDSALDAIADYAWQANETAENIGARRLHTLLEKILNDIAFNAGGGGRPGSGGQGGRRVRARPAFGRYAVQGREKVHPLSHAGVRERAPVLCFMRKFF